MRLCVRTSERENGIGACACASVEVRVRMFVRMCADVCVSSCLHASACVCVCTCVGRFRTQVACAHVCAYAGQRLMSACFGGTTPQRSLFSLDFGMSFT